MDRWSKTQRWFMLPSGIFINRRISMKVATLRLFTQDQLNVSIGEKLAMTSFS